MILFDKCILTKISNFTHCSGFHNEVGGILLGFRKKEHLYITKATLPGRSDQGSYSSFFRRDWSHQMIATNEWVKSGFRVDWVGEWHSHPESNPVPSSTDKTTWTNQTIKRNVDMVYVIIGFHRDWFGIKHVGASKVLKLEFVEENDTKILFQ